MSLDSPYTTPQAAPSPTSEHVSGKLTPKEVLFSFTGRIPRSTFWLYSILSGLAFYAVLLPFMIIFGQESTPTLVATVVAYIPSVWISLAIQIKRWHDRDKSGWWMFIALIPVIGAIWAFVECGCLRGTLGPNRFGNDPLA